MDDSGDIEGHSAGGWRVWLYVDDRWCAGPVMPEGAAWSYAAAQRFAGAVALEPASQKQSGPKAAFVKPLKTPSERR
jgi:hypothetical protein